MTTRWFWGLLWILILAAALQGQSRESVLKAVAQTSNWTPADKPTTYDDKTIQAIAGNRAAAVARYGLIGATKQSWKGPQGVARLTLYELVDPSAAYGW